MATKSETAAEVLIERMERGDYTGERIPSARALADELGISYVTARKALQVVVDAGLMERDETGRMQAIIPGYRQAGKNIAFIAPSFPSNALMLSLTGLKCCHPERGYTASILLYPRP